jgi:hypothetical protein
MERDHPNLVRTASAMAIWPILGLLGGLVLGSVKASLQRAFELDGLVMTIRWGVTGFFLGLAVVLLLSLSLRRKDLISLRRLMALVAIAALLSWYFAKVLFGVIGL